MAFYSPVGGWLPHNQLGSLDVQGHQDEEPTVSPHAIQNLANILQAQLIGRKGRAFQEGPITLNLVQAGEGAQGAGGPSSISTGGR